MSEITIEESVLRSLAREFAEAAAESEADGLGRADGDVLDDLTDEFLHYVKGERR